MGKNARKLIFLLAAGVLLVRMTGHAHPLPPRSLRQLYHQAELIVIAEVLGTEKVDSLDPWHAARADLRVSSSLKGAEVDRVTVYYGEGIPCPSPARYEKGRTVLAFLVPSDKMEGYKTCSLSHGAKALTGNDLEVYRARIETLAEITAISDRETGLRKTTDWLVSCVAEPATRREGLLDLVGPAGGPSSKNRHDPEFQRHLTGEHMDQLLGVLASTVPEGGGLPREVAPLMSILCQRTGREDLGRILETYRDIHWRDPRKRVKQLAVRNEFVAAYKKRGRTKEAVKDRD